MILSRTRAATLATLLLACSAVSLHAADDLDPQSQWPQWRGPRANGVALGDPPVRWSEDRNVRWRAELPGLGHSTPVIWGDRIFVTAAVPHGPELQPLGGHVDGAHHNLDPDRRMKFLALALDAGTGKTLWQRELVDARPHEGVHETGSWASASPVTDGRRLFVSFGSQGLFALTLDGKTLWKRELGQMQVRHGHGEGSSPALDGETLVVNWDHQGQSFVIALDAATGKERWRRERDEITSWSSPLIVEVDGRKQVIIAATGRSRGYDLATGKTLWEVAGLSRNVVATPVAGNGLVHVANSYDTRSLVTVRLAGARGDLTGTDAVVWTRNRDTPYVPSPLLTDDTLCFVKHLHPVLTCVEATNGAARLGPVRLPGLGQIFASPVEASGRLYVADRSGATAVVSLEGERGVLSVNRLDDAFSASPAIVGDALFLRGERWLYRIERPARESEGP